MADFLLRVSGGSAVLGMAAFVTGVVVGVVLEASRSTSALRRMTTRHLAEVRKLQEERKVLRSRLATEE